MDLEGGFIFALQAYERQEQKNKAREDTKIKKGHTAKTPTTTNVVKRRQQKPTVEERRANRELRKFFTKNGHMI